MLPEYLSYWGFQKSPFSLSPDPAMLCMGPQHQEALLRLKYGVTSNKGGVLLISENAGDGKTSILRKLTEDLASEYPGKIKIAFIDHPTLTVNQMVAEIARQLGVAKVRKEKIDNLNELRVKLEALHQAGIKTLVIVDEGQMLVHRPDILQELRILLNFCVGDTFLLSFVLSGQKPLEGALKQMPEFWQRLPVRFFLRNLDLHDTGQLVRFRVRQAGQLDREVFTTTAIEGIHRFSQGCPRVICAVADLALLVGFSMRSQKIDFREVTQATQDMTKSGESFHYASFLSPKDAAKAPRRCPGCRKFVKAKDTACGKCGASLEKAAAPAAAVPEEPKTQCPSCARVSATGGRCQGCGFVLAQPCTRCQYRNAPDAPGCVRCGQRLAGREMLATRDFEEGLRKLGIAPPAPEVARRFPMLQSEGRVYMGCLAPRLLFWRPRPQLSSKDLTVDGSLFVTERSFVFANGRSSRRIPYTEIRGLLVTPEERRSGWAFSQIRIVLDDEEVRVAFPVPTDRPRQLETLLSAFVTNKRFFIPSPPAAVAVREEKHA